MLITNQYKHAVGMRTQKHAKGIYMFITTLLVSGMWYQLFTKRLYQRNSLLCEQSPIVHTSQACSSIPNNASNQMTYEPKPKYLRSECLTTP